MDSELSKLAEHVADLRRCAEIITSNAPDFVAVAEEINVAADELHEIHCHLHAALSATPQADRAAQHPFTWREQWEGSAPTRGWHIREGNRLTHNRVVAYLGDSISSEAVRQIVRSHNDSLSATPQAGRNDGGLPAALHPVARDWYALCERASTVDRISISGELAEAIVAAIRDLSAATPQAAQVPEGYALVPLEPTESMVEAAFLPTHAKHAVLVSANPRIIYRAMLAAAQAQEDARLQCRGCGVLIPGSAPMRCEKCAAEAELDAQAQGVGRG